MKQLKPGAGRASTRYHGELQWAVLGQLVMKEAAIEKEGIFFAFMEAASSTFHVVTRTELQSEVLPCPVSHTI